MFRERLGTVSEFDKKRCIINSTVKERPFDYIGCSSIYQSENHLIRFDEVAQPVFNRLIEYYTSTLSFACFCHSG